MRSDCSSEVGSRARRPRRLLVTATRHRRAHEAVRRMSDVHDHVCRAGRDRGRAADSSGRSASTVSRAQVELRCAASVPSSS